MLDYVISTFYPEIQEAYSDNTVQRNAAFFKEVRKKGSPSAGTGDWSQLKLCITQMSELFFEESTLGRLTY